VNTKIFKFDDIVTKIIDKDHLKIELTNENDSILKNGGNKKSSTSSPEKGKDGKTKFKFAKDKDKKITDDDDIPDWKKRTKTKKDKAAEDKLLVVSAKEKQAIMDAEVEAAVDLSFTYLTEKLIKYRAKLERNFRHGAVEELDFQWGLEKVDKVISPDENEYPGFFLANQDSTQTVEWRDESRIKKSLKKINRAALLRTYDLQKLSDSAAGVAIMHLFVRDLLGRGTPMSNVYHEKTLAVYAEAHTINQPIKVLAFVILCLLDLYFFTMVISYAKMASDKYEGGGDAWQAVWLKLAALTVLIEVVYKQTAEAIFVSYVFPNIIYHNVSDSEKVLLKLAATVVKGTVSRPKPILDLDSFSASDYIFESVLVARKFPHLFESAMVMTYREPLPGMNFLDQDWARDGLARLVNKGINPDIYYEHFDMDETIEQKQLRLKLEKKYVKSGQLSKKKNLSHGGQTPTKPVLAITDETRNEEEYLEKEEQIEPIESIESGEPGELINLNEIAKDNDGHQFAEPDHVWDIPEREISDEDERSPDFDIEKAIVGHQKPPKKRKLKKSYKCFGNIGYFRICSQTGVVSLVLLVAGMPEGIQRLAVDCVAPAFSGGLIFVIGKISSDDVSSLLIKIAVIIGIFAAIVFFFYRYIKSVQQEYEHVEAKIDEQDEHRQDLIKYIEGDTNDMIPSDDEPPPVVEDPEITRLRKREENKNVSALDKLKKTKESDPVYDAEQKKKKREEEKAKARALKNGGFKRAASNNKNDNIGSSSRVRMDFDDTADVGGGESEQDDEVVYGSLVTLTTDAGGVSTENGGPQNNSRTTILEPIKNNIVFHDDDDYQFNSDDDGNSSDSDTERRRQSKKEEKRREKLKRRAARARRRKRRAEKALLLEEEEEEGNLELDIPPTLRGSLLINHSSDLKKKSWSEVNALPPIESINKIGKVKEKDFDSSFIDDYSEHEVRISSRRNELKKKSSMEILKGFSSILQIDEDISDDDDYHYNEDGNLVLGSKFSKGDRKQPSTKYIRSNAISDRGGNNRINPITTHMSSEDLDDDQSQYLAQMYNKLDI
jgi:hypothetical protein